MLELDYVDFVAAFSLYYVTARFSTHFGGILHFVNKVRLDERPLPPTVSLTSETFERETVCV
jgi:hypothetical protein